MRTRVDSTSFVLLRTQSEFQKWFQKLASTLHTGDEILYAGPKPKTWGALAVACSNAKTGQRHKQMAPW